MSHESDKDDNCSVRVPLRDRSFISGVTIPSSGTEAQREAKFSGKHAPYLLFIIDEGDAVPDEVYRGIESCMSGGHARLLVMFNPRNQSGEVHRMERDRRANVVKLSAFSHPNVLTGEDQIPGAVTRETTIRRINQWCRPLAEDEAEESLAVFDLLKKPDLSAGEIKKVKAVAVDLLKTLKEEKLRITRWQDKEATRDAVRQAIFDFLWTDSTGLPVDKYTEGDVQVKADDVYRHVYRVYPTLPSPFYSTAAAV